MYKLFTLLLQCWLLGAVLLVLYSLAALMADCFKYDARKGHWPQPIVRFSMRLVMALVWPMALATKDGRSTLFSNYKDIN